jgi:hypothetical protein
MKMLTTKQRYLKCDGSVDFRSKHQQIGFFNFPTEISIPPLKFVSIFKDFQFIIKQEGTRSRGPTPATEREKP